MTAASPQATALKIRSPLGVVLISGWRFQYIGSQPPSAKVDGLWANTPVLSI